jgi:hypothetical protein
MKPYLHCRSHRSSGGLTCDNTSIRYEVLEEIVLNEMNKMIEKYYNLKIYGEWLIPHHCDYQNTFYCNFYVFDIMETINIGLKIKLKNSAKNATLITFLFFMKVNLLLGKTLKPLLDKQKWVQVRVKVLL